MRRYRLHIVLVAIAILFMPDAIHDAYIKRGYFAVGGEWLLPVLGYVIAEMITQLCEFTKELSEVVKQWK